MLLACLLKNVLFKLPIPLLIKFYRGSGDCIVMLFVLITIMLGFSFIQYTNTWLSHKAFFITRDIDI